MELTVNGVSYHIDVLGEGREAVLVLLHGFTGSTETWKRTAEEWAEYQVVAVDLIGHGKTESPSDASRYAMDQQLADLEAIFEKLELSAFTLLGYSMGGRTALAYACNYPDRIERLILESASPGLKDERAKQQRRQSDAELAQSILDQGLEAFVEKWENIPLFESQKSLPEKVQQEIRKERLAQSAVGLAHSLLGMGTGSQLSYWGCLPTLEMPVLLLTGELDPKFCAIAKEMTELLPNAHHRIISAGHAIHVEKPAEFATIVKELLNGINEED